MSQPLIVALTGQVTGRSPTQPQDCGQSPVFRRPAKHLQTTADFRLGWQVTLAQPSASSQGYRLRRADQSSSPGQGPRLQWYSHSSGTSVSPTAQRNHISTPDDRLSHQQIHRPQAHFFSPLFRLNLICPFCASARPRVARSGSVLTPPLHLTLPLIFTFPLQPGSTTSQSQPLIAALTGQVTGRSPTQPQDCGQSPVFRRPAKHLQTTADFRLGRQVTLAQPSASSQGYRLRRADQSSSPGQGPRLHQVAASHSSLHQTGHRSCADATLKLWSVSGLQETS